ncbi:hypothetical protein A2U01_0021024, partial [Trifolium medium]|nr:hypothetical protein [Trifolium medium]
MLDGGEVLSCSYFGQKFVEFFVSELSSVICDHGEGDPESSKRSIPHHAKGHGDDNVLSSIGGAKVELKVEHRHHPTVVIDVAYEEDLGSLFYARFRQSFLDERLIASFPFPGAPEFDRTSAHELCSLGTCLTSDSFNRANFSLINAKYS